MRFGICNETFQGWNWPDVCACAAGAGYDALEVAPFTISDDARLAPDAQLTECRRVAADHGLEIIGLHWLLVSPKGLSLTGDSAILRERTSDYLCRLVDVCALLGGTRMVLGSPGQRRIPAGRTASQATRRLADALLPSLDLAAAAGITLCLEPLPPPEADLLLTLDEVRSAMAIHNHPAMKTILDVKSASSEAISIKELIESHAPVIAHVHANDANRRGPGFGATDFRPIIGALQSVGYDGVVSVEVFDYSPDPRTIAVESLRYLRDCAGVA